MKTNILTLTSMLIILSACGPAARYSGTQTYQDGIYSHPDNSASRAAALASRSKVDDLVKETENSSVFLKAGQTDTLFIPENMSTTLNLGKTQGGTSVTITNNNGYSLYPQGYADGFAAGFASSYWPGYYWDSWRYPYYGSSWYWGANPWYYSSSIWWDAWYWNDPWYYSSWYWRRPGYYWGYYDPWYYNRWY